MHTLYDADHYKMALGKLATAKNLIETISRDYVRLLKYGQSLFQCKQLKRAALGRMATLVKRLDEALKYLDQVRQHLGRLPSINPEDRTLVICGYPNVGKSSFLKSISRADVDVQPYAFTTKSLFVGHFDYQYLRFQAIDTPGILDHPLDEMNNIEMQSITAIAHLKSVILYFMDLSEQCGYPVSSQIQLFKSIRPLFANKIVFIVINKIDLKRPEDLDPETKAELDALLKTGGVVKMIEASCNTQEGVQAVKNTACEHLIAHRVKNKLAAGTNSNGEVSDRLANLLGRIHVAMPLPGAVSEPFVPEAVKNLKKYDRNDPERRKLARDIEAENGGPGVYNVDLRAEYILKDPAWKYDKVPEIFDGKNVYDWIDPDIDAKLQALEEEEEKLEAEGFYDSDDEELDEEDQKTMQQAEAIRERLALIRNEAKMRKSLKNRAIIPRKAMRRPLSELEEHLDEMGIDTEELQLRKRGIVQAETRRGRSLSRAASRGASATADADADLMDVDSTPQERLRSKSRPRDRSQPATNRREDGVADPTVRSKAERQAKLAQRKMNRMARQGEADRHIGASMPKHLVSLVCLSLLTQWHGLLLTVLPTVCWQAWVGQDQPEMKFHRLLTIGCRGT